MLRFRLDLDRPVKCTFYFPHVVVYSERFSQRVRCSDGLFYTPLAEYYDVVRDCGRAPENPREAEWVHPSLRPIRTEVVSEEGVVVQYRVSSAYELASLLYAFGRKLKWGRIVVLSDYPNAFWERFMGLFVSATPETILVVPVEKLFDAGKRELEGIFPIYCLVVDPSVGALREVVEEVFGFFGAKIGVHVTAPSPKTLVRVPLRLEELRAISPSRAELISRRFAELVASKKLSASEARRVIFEEEGVLV